MATLLSNERITAKDHFQDTRHIEFDLGDRGPLYRPGDVLATFPGQEPALVRRVVDRLGIGRQWQIRLSLKETHTSYGDMQSMQVSQGGSGNVCHISAVDLWIP